MTRTAGSDCSQDRTCGANAVSAVPPSVSATIQVLLSPPSLPAKWSML
eukprot:CAMPEP_0173321114 /NCGR_PEP_ID=MMETSP1143-20121109/29223_1 /TAXON_ID=483371 /ORGANISM="non described non described, Strain CCMP2298" /LENGTH=47 /DNA_ID= /DNA_START= /DNA_END= /DNA_ORIENTATION=